MTRPNRKCLVCFKVQPASFFADDDDTKCSICKTVEKEERRKKAAAERKEIRRKKVNRAKHAERKEQFIKNYSAAGLKAIEEKRKASLKTTEVKRIKGAEEGASPVVTVSPAQQELAKRALARRHMLPFTKMFLPRYKAGWFHKYVCERLEQFYQDVVDEKRPRLMLFVPPRHGKSELASVQFPAWVFGQDPSIEIMLTSYAMDLSSVFSRKVRDRIKNDARYHTLFEGTRLSKTQENIAHWSTTQGGSFIAAGIGGPITGKGGNIAIIDDPVKNREEADSETIQDRNWAWYRSTFRTRLAPGAGILVIQTRWSYDDVSGKLIQQMEKAMGEDHEQWEIINFPALAEQDEYIDLETKKIIRDPVIVADNMRLLRKQHEALHPERYDEKELRTIRNTVGTREWSALYQQQPLPDSGDFFRKEWFRYRNPPGDYWEGMKHIMACDLALGTKKHNNQSAFAIGAIDYKGNLWIREVLFGKWTTHEVVELILDKQVEYSLDLVGIERGPTKLAVDDQIRLRSRERNVHPTFHEDLVATTDKEIRARPIQGLIQAGVVLWPENNPWWFGPTQNQLLRFPASTENDIVDAMAWLGRMYDYAGKPKDPTKMNKKRQSRWQDQLVGLVKGGRSHMSA
jgi:predicted phage terminase large subunit-like protein